MSYDAPLTPFFRLLQDPRLNEEQKQQIITKRQTYDMIELKKRLDRALKNEGQQIEWDDRRGLWRIIASFTGYLVIS